MSAANHSVDSLLATYAAQTLSAAPTPIHPAVIRILAERRRAAAKARRLSWLLALTSAVPPLVGLAAWVIRRAEGGTLLLVAVIAAWGLPAFAAGLFSMAIGQRR